MSFTKQVTFSEPVQQVLNEAVCLPKLEMEDSLTFTRIETPVNDKKKPDSGSKPINKKKFKKRQTVAKSQKLERENVRLSKEPIVRRKSIDEDGAKESKNYTPYQNRRHGRTTSEPLQSKIIIIQRQIEGKESNRKQRGKKVLRTKVKKNLITTSKQHKRILDLTDKMVEIQLKEAELRTEISSKISTMSSLSSFSSRASSTRPNTSEDWERVSSAVEFCSGLHGKEEVVDEGVEDELRLISGLGAYVPRLEDKITNVDKLARNYAMKRELRNTIHQHMISRSYSYSYFNAIPPYKKKKEKPRKAKLFFNRKVYEDKITVLDFSKKVKSKSSVKAF